MRIALLTIWHEENFGAEWQAYATVRALKELGHEVEVINLRLADLKAFSIRSAIGRFVRSMMPNGRHFARFWNKYIPYGRRYRSYNELKNNPPKADMYLVGSDQTWNPQITKDFYEAFLLHFGPENIRRASYAASIGLNEWRFDKIITDNTKKGLSLFSYVSCREETGCSILKKEFGIDAVNVLDPTLLHKHYDEFFKVNNEYNTLAYYLLDDDPELEAYSMRLSEKLGLDCVNANCKKYLMGRFIWDRTTIQQWMYKIATSKLVVTRSFHGLVVSLLYHRQFVILNNSDRNSRILDLLKKINLEDRCYRSIQEIEENKPWERPINYEKVDSKLAQLRAESLSYLKMITSNSGK